MPMGCGGGAGFDLAALGVALLVLALGLIRPPRYCTVGLGEVADGTAGESYGRAEGLGDRGYGLCDAAAMVLAWFKSQFPTA